MSVSGPRFSSSSKYPTMDFIKELEEKRKAEKKAKLQKELQEATQKRKELEQKLAKEEGKSTSSGKGTLNQFA
jgi:single-stranded DNA-specific DHH superfamily exonuclease